MEELDVFARRAIERLAISIQPDGRDVVPLSQESIDALDRLGNRIFASVVRACVEAAIHRVGGASMDRVVVDASDLAFALSSLHLPIPA